MYHDEAPDHPILRALDDQEDIHARARAGDVEIIVTDRRLAVASRDRMMLNVAIDGLRRIQFDIERQRPATLVVVPEDPTHEPQVLAIPPEEYEDIARALVVVGRRLASLPNPAS
jgi:hypothetical protein